jgi:zinc transporter ZupT
VHFLTAPLCARKYCTVFRQRLPLCPDSLTAIKGTRLQVMETSLWGPVLMSFIAGSATTLGGLIVYTQKELPSELTIARVLAFAAGVMSMVSVFDLWLPVASLSVSYFLASTLFLCLGVVLCLFVEKIPFPDPSDLYTAITSGKAGDVWAALRTPQSSSLPLVVPADAADSSNKSLGRRSAAWRLGVVLFIVLSAHNFPEGVAVGLSNVKSSELGLLLTIAMYV